MHHQKCIMMYYTCNLYKRNNIDFRKIKTYRKTKYWKISYLLYKNHHSEMIYKESIFFIQNILIDAYYIKEYTN